MTTVSFWVGVSLAQPDKFLPTDWHNHRLPAKQADYFLAIFVFLGGAHSAPREREARAEKIICL